ncbi:cadherin-like beta sandwich domain-containing protein [Hydrogenoanaerobacterium sp.]|uniref:cadherin-like beta sandwich domain-containing protein n=1 Tax=Hydrogenoanaerobacterium sp. TaxID=2953763 RepID=UPI00289E776B|nr:cadherin-like beta sandwich domain-containing protein [Hydrogenoanaerobacterium sp.]
MKRYLAFFLALVLLFTVPEAAFVTMAAPASAVPEVKFVGSESATAADVIEGNGAEVSIGTSTQYTLGSPPFIIQGMGGTAAAENITYNNATKSFSTKEGAAGTKPEGMERMESYSITANFFAITATGTALESWNDGAMAVDVTSESRMAILEKSSIKIKADSDEKEGNVRFSVVGTPTGAFSRYKDGATISGQRATGGKDPRPLEVNFWDGSSEGQKTDIKLLVYTKQGTIIPDSVPEKKEYKVTAGTTYEIVFSTAPSSPMIMRVWSAKAAASQLAKAVVNDVTKSKYVILTNKSDDYNWITTEFKLATEVPYFGAKFDIDWVWEWDQNDPYGSAAIEKIDNDGSTDDQNKTIKTTRAKVHKQESDVKGILKAKITCLIDGKPVADSVTEAEVPITVKGKGRPAYIKLLTQQVGGKDPTNIAPTEGASNKIENIPKNMDVYDNSVTGATETTNLPYRFYSTMYMGEKNAAAEYVIIHADDPNVLKIFMDGQPAAYAYNTKVNNPNPKGVGSIDLEFVAAKEGSTRIFFDFYCKGNGGRIEKYQTIETPIISVQDTTPRKDATLASLTLRRNNDKLFGLIAGEEYDYGFKPETTQYKFEVPFRDTAKITLVPVLNDKKAKKTIEVEIVAVDGTKQTSEVESGKPITVNLPDEGDTATVRITTTAQNPSIKMIYKLEITRAYKSIDSTLKDLKISNSKDTAQKNLLTGFKGSQTSYELSVPYSVKQVRVQATPNFIEAKAEIISPEPKKQNILSSTADLIDLGYGEGVNPTDIKVKVTAENEAYATEYSVAVRRLDPSTIATLDSLIITDNAENPITFTPKFNKDTLVYEMQIPYAVDSIKVKAKPTDANVSSIKVRDVYKSDDETKQWVDLKSDVLSAKILVDSTTDEKPVFNIPIKVTAEDEKTEVIYELEITREKPSDEASLTSLDIVDQNKKVIEYDFYPDTMQYTIPVAYESESVMFTPKAAFYAPYEITINGKKIKNGQQSYAFKLGKHPEVTRFEVKVTAEDKTTIKTYVIEIARAKPSADNLLKSLSITGLKEFKPIFVPSKQSYKGIIADGGKSVVVTATANHPYAIIKINGKKAESGKPFDAIDVVEVDSTINIEVIAQNGTDKRSYDVKLTNENLIDKSSNADLRSLEVKDGYMSPEFKPSISTYEVSVKDETSFVDIIPSAADRLAKVRVLSGTKEIGDEYGDYSEAITNGENNFTVEVTSPDKTTVKKYYINVFRGDEEKQGLLKPITPDIIDFKGSDNIVVDISKYAMVSADVFNELKKYPNKVITFVGNDYSLQFKARDIKKIIPHEKVYDFSMLFTSPDEEAIYDLMREKSANDKLEPVMIYFKHHGELPAPTTFTLSLGQKYKNKKLYWHYYNKERDRIDYYGYFNTNSKGTFAIKLDHFSTYFITIKIVVGSEDKSGANGAMGGGNLGLVDRVNPDTGEMHRRYGIGGDKP